MDKQKRRVYSRDHMSEAVEACRNGSKSTIQASKDFGIPLSTLKRLKGNTVFNPLGRRTCLTSTEEIYLVETLKQLNESGVRLTKSRVQELATSYLTKLRKLDPSGESECFG